MKRMMIVLLAVGMATVSCTTSMVAMSSNQLRQETRFLTDKMAYELNLSTRQYNDVYEINYDFIYSAQYLMDNVLRGESWAMDRYYNLLDVRNDDLRWVLSASQYRRFMGVDYFYRPIYANGNKWQFRVYVQYTNHNHYYYGKPPHYSSYKGAHYRTHYNNKSYYSGRYKHDVYNGNYSVRNEKVYVTNRRSDFGSVTMRPNSDKPSSNAAPSKNASKRPSNTDKKTNTRENNASSVNSSNDRKASATRPGSSSSSSSSSSDVKKPSGSSNTNATRPTSSGSSSRPSATSSSKKENNKDSSSTTRSTSTSSKRDSKSNSSSSSTSTTKGNSTRR